MFLFIPHFLCVIPLLLLVRFHSVFGWRSHQFRERVLVGRSYATGVNFLDAKLAKTRPTKKVIRATERAEVLRRTDFVN